MLRKFGFRSSFIALVVAVALVVPFVAPASADGGFVPGLAIALDGEDYYLAGAPVGSEGAQDIPGHEWEQITATELVGRHFNTGPGGKAQWWSSDADDGQLLYVVNALIDTWSPEKAKWYAGQGFGHYHEFVRASDGELHPDKVVWLRHIAVDDFTLDGGPHPEMAHAVTAGLDPIFIPNGPMPYDPEAE